MDPSTGVCGFATDFSRLPVQIAGPNEDINIQINPDSIRTGAFTYTMDISGNNVTITATPHRSGTYNYIITADSRTSQILCIVGAESGRKICSAIGTSLDDNDYLIN